VAVLSAPQIKRALLSKGENNMSDLLYPFIDIPIKDYGVFLVRLADGRCATNVPLLKQSDYSDLGYDWGNLGSKSSELALHILDHVFRELNSFSYHKHDRFGDAFMLHQVFKRDILAYIPRSGGFIPWTRILHWLNKQETHDFIIPISIFGPERSIIVAVPSSVINFSFDLRYALEMPKRTLSLAKSKERFLCLLLDAVDECVEQATTRTLFYDASESIDEVLIVDTKLTSPDQQEKFIALIEPYVAYLFLHPELWHVFGQKHTAN
jgi:hypothetical protein